METVTSPPARTSSTLVVSEVFSPTVQGEGPSAGRRAGFIRLAGCNLHCSWCDSAYTWDASRFDLRAEATRMPVDEIVSRAITGSPHVIVITGGEPLLHQHQPGWRQLLALLGMGGWRVEVETNGTVAPDDATVRAVSQFNVSPKLTSAGDPAQARFRPAALAAFRASRKAVFKFVCRTAADVDEAAVFAARAAIPARLVWIMPEGTTPGEITRHLQAIADPAVTRGFNLTSRLHVLAWGNERGR